MPPTKQKVYPQRFRKEWLKDPLCQEWIKEINDDSSKAFCKLCFSTIQAKYDCIKNHRLSKKHAARAKALNKQPRITSSTLTKKTNDENEIATAEVRAALFIAEHCSILTCDHLTDFCKAAFPNSKIATGMKLRRTKCSALLKNVLKPHFLDDLKQDIGDEKFSLLLDESTDISYTKYLGIVIIYFSKSKKKVVSSFLELAKLPQCTATDIFHALKETLQRHGLDFSKLIGIGTDNASVMTGIHNGLYARLKEEQPSLVLVRCLCHSLQLATSFAVCETLPRNLDYMVSETYNWFSKSSSRQLAYKQIFNLINDGHDPPRIVRSCKTRWLSVATAVTRIHDQWAELKAHFEITRRSEHCYAAEVLFSMFSDERNKIYFQYLKSISNEVQRVNLIFQADKPDPTKLVDSLVFLIESLLKQIVIPTRRIDPFNSCIEENLDFKAYLGYETEKSFRDLKLPEVEEKVIRERCIKFVACLVKQIRQRVPENVKMLQKMSMFSVRNALNAVKDPVTDVLEFFNVPAEDIGKIEMQWKNITLVQWQNTCDTQGFWAEVSSYEDAVGENPFSNLAKIARSILFISSF